jgi:ribulose-5-phosphate 4-epimerase/fuculose-1-phosphate aldolase
LSCLPDIEPDDAIPPLTPYVVMRVGRVKLVPYVRPGDPAMGQLIRDLKGRYAAVLLANHGPVVSAKDVESAVYASEELEETAKLVLLLRGKDARRLTDAQIEELVRVFQAPR